jgi:hypothetical protein
MSQIKYLLDYAATHPNVILWGYHAIDMVLHIDSDSAYLVLPKARSRAAGYHYLSSNTTPIDTATPKPNAAVHVEC